MTGRDNSQIDMKNEVLKFRRVWENPKPSSPVRSKSDEETAKLLKAFNPPTIP